MSNIIFTATGCTRCKIVKSFMNERNIPYVEKDMKSEGKEEFQNFYKANRSNIYRGPDGIEFPIITDGKNIRQGIGASIAYLHSGDKLDGFFSVGTLHKEWVDGIHISLGNPEYTEDFIEVLRYFKGNNLKLQIETNGNNSHILQKILDEGLADVVIMNVLGPLDLYRQIFRKDFSSHEIEKSIALLPQFPEYRFETTVSPIIRKEGEQAEISYLTPEEVGEAAKLIEKVTGSKKNPYLIRLFRPEKATDERFKSIEPISPNMLFTYRTAARAYQVFTEIEKV